MNAKTVATWALLLMIPSAAWAGALGLAVVMAGATLTESFVLSGNPIMPLVLMVLLSLVAYARRPVATGRSRGWRGRQAVAAEIKGP